MSERSKYLTVIVSDPTQEEASALIGHPKMSAASWSHAIHDRDAKDAEIAELRKLAACAYQAMGVHDAPDNWLESLSSAASGNPFETDSLLPYAPQAVCDVIAERDEARECVRRLYEPLNAIVYWQSQGRSIDDSWFEAAQEALAATPEHLRG